MDRYLALLILWSSLTTTVHCDDNPVPFALEWSSKTYGPDGPWQAVTVEIGTPGQKTDLYPGGAWASHILSTEICSNKSLADICEGEKASLFDPGSSSSLDNSSISLQYNNGLSGPIPFSYMDTAMEYGLAERALDTITIRGVPTLSSNLAIVSSVYQKYPGGNYPVQLGVLSLGAPELNQTFTSRFSSDVNGTFVNSYLYTSGGGKSIPSYSYGMHIGSAAFNIPGTVMLGGYDESRVIGDVTSQSYNGGSFPIWLLDIEIGVAKGASPWAHRNATNLLGKGNSSIASGLSVLVDPAAPYMYLPKSSCDAIASHLPVTFQEDYGLYFWNTEDDKYKEIVTTPSYLAFRFRKDSSNVESIKINVPFALLNLTLEYPLVDRPTQYFPCMPTTGNYGLGRAFLQAAFVGVNWGPGIGSWFLAQAPGPNYKRTPSTAVISSEATAIPGTKGSWEKTWNGHWNVISAPTTNPSTTGTPSPDKGNDSTSTSDDGGLSTGAKAGIGVGCAVAGLILIAAAAFMLIRRRRRSKQSAGNAALDTRGQSPIQIGYFGREKNMSPQPVEMGHERPMAELPT